MVVTFGFRVTIGIGVTKLGMRNSIRDRTMQGVGEFMTTAERRGSGL